MKRQLGQMGFTLIELMVVVTIIGILASIGTVSFQNMMHKTRQNQAKSQMNIIYTGMRNFHAEWNQYFGDWNNLGIEINGDLYYRVGFHISVGPTAPTSPTNYIGAGVPAGGNGVAVNSNPAAGYCGNMASTGFPCREMTGRPGVCGMMGAAVCTWVNGTPDTFTICGCSQTRSSTGTNIEDQWTLDQAKTWTHTEI